MPKLTSTSARRNPLYPALGESLPLALEEAGQRAEADRLRTQLALLRSDSGYQLGILLLNRQLGLRCRRFSFRFQFRSEFFNLFNRVNLSNPLGLKLLF